MSVISTGRVDTFRRRLAAAGLLAGMTAMGIGGLWPQPAAAQFFDWGGRSDWNRPQQRPQPQQPSYNPFQQFFSTPFRPSRPQDRGPYYQRSGPAPAPAQQQQQQQQADYSKAPPPHKPDVPPTTTIAVVGDAMADWLAYGLEDAFGDTPEIGIVRKNRTYSGLIRYDPRTDTDWARAARELLTTDKPNYVVMMIGLNDRQSLRERVAAKPVPQPAQPQNKDQPAAAAPAGQAPQPKDQEAAQSAPADDQQANDVPGDGPDQPAAAAPAVADASAPGRGPIREFHTEKWEDAYGKLIEDTVAALKGKTGTPVFWVGLPSVRGAKSTADMTYLNTLFRAHAEKAGAIYIDVWDGFVDESGRFTLQGPDFEGQIRRLRTPDGVFFTRSGSRKLAHYVEREIRRVMASRAVPVALTAPQEPVPQTAAKPGEAPPRPVAGPVVPLTAFAATGSDDQLLGGGPIRAANADAAVARVLVKGEAVAPAKDRAALLVWAR